MNYTGERFIPTEKMSVMALEHLHRYYWATSLVKDKSVLDIACGEGYGTAILSNSCRQVCGCDISAAAIDHAKSHYPDLDFRVMGLENIDFPPASVDVIACFETIEHVKADVQSAALRKFAEILKPYGLLLISTPSTTSPLHVANRFHLKEMAEDEFRAALQQHFAFVRVLGQSVYCASVITDGGKTKITNFPKVPERGQERYLLAVCSKEPLPEDLGSIFIDRGNQTMQQLVHIKKCVGKFLPLYNFMIGVAAFLMPTTKFKQKISSYRW